MAKLTYFGLRGMGEQIRILCHDQSYDYSEDVIDSASWLSIKEQGLKDGTLPLGQVPKFTFKDGKSLAQSGAIMRHFGRLLGLYGKDDWERAKIDEIYECIVDWRRDYLILIYVDRLADDKLAAFKANNKANLLSQHLARVGSGFVVGQQISFADYSLLDLVDIILRIHPEVFKEAPELKKHYEMMKSRPKIHAYFQSNPEHRQKVTGNGLG